MASLLNMSGAGLLKKKPLPYDAEVEYIETKDSSQFIDTGIYSSADLSFYVDYDNANTGGSPYGNAFGDKTNSPCYRLTKYSGGLFRVDGKDVNNLGFNTAGRHTISYDGVGNVYVDGTLKKTVSPNTYTPSYTIILFGTRRDNDGGMQQGMANNKMYRCTFGDVADFIPVRKGTDGYMYDTVRQQLFAATNGTTFNVGSDKF